MSFDGLFVDGAVFGCVGEGESISGSKVPSMDICKPHGLDRKACYSVEVSDAGVDAGEVMGIQGGGSRDPLRQNRWISLGKERKTPEFGAGEFAPAAKDDHVVLVEHSDRGFSEQNLAVLVTKFPNPHQVVMEIGNDVPASDRYPWEEHITRCSRDMWGGTGGANNNLQSGGVDVGAGLTTYGNYLVITLFSSW